MKIITVEEHYNSVKVKEKIREIYEEHGTEEEGGSIGRALSTTGVDGVMELGPQRIVHMDQYGFDAQVISCAGIVPATLNLEYSVSLCQEVNNEMYQQAKLYSGVFIALPTCPWALRRLRPGNWSAV